jgi:hypothetical protein
VAGKLGYSDISWRYAYRIGVPPHQKAGKSEELTYLSENIDCHSLFSKEWLFWHEPKLAFYFGVKALDQYL